jgi:hypothetical protein
MSNVSKGQTVKHLMIGLMASVSLLAALPAAAAQNASVAINGAAPAQCGVSGSTTATLTGGGAAGLADANGFLDSSAQVRIVAALNNTNTQAWCTGGSTIVVTRTPLVRTGTTGRIDTSGFVNAIGYDVAVKITGASRTDPYLSPGFGGGVEGSSDGNSGPGFNPFGPTGNGSIVQFVNDDYAPSQSFDATPSLLDLTSGASFTGPTATLRTQAVANTTRLAAGNYTSTVTLTITPTS